MIETLSRLRRIHRRDGVRRAAIKLLLFAFYGKRFREELDARDYRRWIRKNERSREDDIREQLKGFRLQPLISLIVPVYNVQPRWLDRCLRSVEDQYYGNWELCLYDDGSSAKETIESLKQWEGKRDPRIKIRYGRRNLHISGASNEALKMATGEFIALLDHDDELSPDALWENVKVINRQPDVDMIYSDEDKISETGERSTPFFKPAWSPDLILSHMYSGHLGVYRKALVDRIGGFRAGYEGSQDYDLVLRFIERTKEERIVHIPKILYHWRMIAGSTAIRPGAKNYAYEAARQAISDCLEQKGEKAVVKISDQWGCYRVIRKIAGEPKVSIVICSADQGALARCLKSISQTVTYGNIEIIVVAGPRADSRDGLEGSVTPPLVFVESGDIDPPAPRAYNLGADRSGGEYLLFLEERLEAVKAGWLEAMLEQIQRKEIGIVGGEILKEDGTIASAGLVLDKERVCVNAFEDYRHDNVPYFGQHHVIRNCSAVPAGCLMTKKELFAEAGGFSEEALPRVYYDVDLCLKLAQRGYRILYTPFAKFMIHRKKARGKTPGPGSNRRDRDPEEKSYMKKTWGHCLGHDPFYNPNLSSDGKFNIRTGVVPS